MSKVVFTVVVLIFLISTGLQAQESTTQDSTTQNVISLDSISRDSTAQATISDDSLAVIGEEDTLTGPGIQQDDSAQKTEKIKVVRRNLKYRDQIGTALGMMAFIAIILTTVQNWNPD